MSTTQSFNIAQTFEVATPAGMTIEGFADATHPQIR